MQAGWRARRSATVATVAAGAAVALMAALASACSKTRSAAACRREAHELAAFLTATNQGMPAIWIDDTMHPVQRADVTAAPAFAPTVSVTRTELRFYGTTVVLDELADRLAVAHRDAKPDVVDVVIDRDTPWAAVVAVARAAHAAGFHHLALIFARPVTDAVVPPRSSIDDQIEAALHADPAERATQIAALMGKTIKGCAALEAAFGAVSGTEGEDKAKTLIRAIEPALVDCHCAPDLSAIRAIMFRILWNPHPTVALTLTLDATAPVVAFGAATSWREASARFTKDATLWLDQSP